MARYLGQRWLLVFGILVITGPSALAQDAPQASDPDGQKLVKELVARCRQWVIQPSPDLKSLKYTYHLGNDERAVELVAGVSRVRESMWQGATLFTGLHALLRAPDRFDIEVHRAADSTKDAEPDLRLIVRPKNAGEPVRLEAGNGVDGSWRGYFSHSSAEMRLELDRKTMLPHRELHEHSQYEFRDWQEVRAGEWVPQLVIVKRGDSTYRMHFAWHANAAWLLTSAEIESQDRTNTIARTSDVTVNDEAVIAKQSEDERRQNDAREIVRQMLVKNAAWLAPKPSFDSLEYTFHTERQDVKETCVVRRDGLAVIEVAHDGQGKMADRLGDRLIVLADGRTAKAHRGEPRAFIHDAPLDRRRPNLGPQLRRYALIGCQFDLPLFELERMLDNTTVKIADGEWNGVPCHVATITIPPRSANLGCGVMLGFTSWSYVHDIRPAYEVVYIDKERHVPLHETLVSDRDDRRFEIDFMARRKKSVTLEWTEILECRITRSHERGRILDF